MCCCYCSYHGLINLKYDNHTAKTTPAKRLVMEKSISVREAVRQLHANAYLEEYQVGTQWASLRVPSPSDVPPCHCYWLELAWPHDLLGQMGTVSGVRPRVESTAMELISPDSTWEEIAEPYWDIYQLQRLPRGSHYKEGTEEHLCQEVLDSIKEHLWHKWPSTLLETEHKWRPADSHRPNPQAKFTAMHCATYEQFAATQWDLCKEALATTGHTHQCALAAMALLEEKIECMSHSLSDQH